MARILVERQTICHRRLAHVGGYAGRAGEDRQDIFQRHSCPASPLKAFDRVVVRQPQASQQVTSYHPSMTDSLRGSAPPWYTPVSGFTRIGAKPFLIPHGPTTSTWCPLALSASITAGERRASTCKRFG